MATGPAGRLICLFGTWILCLASQSVWSGLAREPNHLRARGEIQPAGKRLCTSSRGGALLSWGRSYVGKTGLRGGGSGEEILCGAMKLRGGWNGQEWIHRITDETIKYLEQTDLIQKWRWDNTTEETRSGDAFGLLRSCYPPFPSLPRSIYVSHLALSYSPSHLSHLPISRDGAVRRCRPLIQMDTLILMAKRFQDKDAEGNLGTSHSSVEIYSTLEATQGQIGGFFCQIPHKCIPNQVASVGD